jgi:hypothetical protein
MIIAVAFAIAGCQTPRPPATTPPATTPPATTPPASATSSSDNGIADEPAEQIAVVAVRGMTSKYPMRIRVTVMDDHGQPALTFDVVRDFTDGRGTVQIGGHTLQIVRRNGHDYAKADAGFWRTYGPPNLRDPDRVAKIEGKWVRGNLYSSGLPVGRFLDFHDDLWEALVNGKQFAKGDRVVINGVPSIAVTSNYIGTVYVATEGEPNVVRVLADNGTFFDYSEYGKPVVIDEPPADQTVDLDTVTGARS